MKDMVPFVIGLHDSTLLGSVRIALKKVKQKLSTFLVNLGEGFIKITRDESEVSSKSNFKFFY